MTSIRSGAVPRLVESLARVAKRHRVARKLLICSNFAAGRELLRRLSLSGKGWIGFEATTPRRLALRLAGAPMERSGLTALDAFDQQALLDEALDSALVAEGGTFGRLSEGVGFREKVHGAITALRLAGIGPKELDAARFGDWRKKLFLLRVLQRYERLLADRKRADTAAILGLAIGALEDEGRRLPDSLGADVVLLLPELSTRGLTGRLIGSLAARGAKVLETDPVHGLEVPDSILWNRSTEPSFGSHLYSPVTLAPEGERPDIDFFRAASITDELREVLRRISEQGLGWDQVEIVTPDAAAYGSALHAISDRLGIPVTYAVGLPVERTRTGRVVRAYLDWIEEGFQASPIRRLLEAGDLRPPKSRGQPAAAALARRFRALRIGWGRKRYRLQIGEALTGVERLAPGRGESEEGFQIRRDRLRAELEALKSILFPALKVTPAVPDRMGQGDDPVSPAELAAGLRAFLRRVPRGRGPDRSAREEVGRVLDRVEATLRRRTNFRAAVAILRRHLEVRVRARVPGADEEHAGAPWSSEGGSLHLSDLEHAGFAGREAVFFVGLDAERVPGSGSQDPLLLDGDRRVLGGGLPTSTELLKQRVFRFAALFARLTGRVTMSYRSWQATEARAVGPSPVLLQALRLTRGDPDLTFQDLRRATHRVVSAIPMKGRPLLDSDDVWMAALGQGGLMKSGVLAVRGAFPRLDRGLEARTERLGGIPGPTHGIIEPRPEELDPRRNSTTVVSASRLEALGACPLRYLHGSVLRIYPPDDPELDPDRWLDPLRRGSLLHSVYDVTLRDGRERGLAPGDDAFEALALQTLATGIARVRGEVPVPGEGTLRREIAGLEEDVRSFVRMVRQHGAPWVALELKFGLGDDDPVVLELGGGSLRLRGAIDRVDEDLHGLHVVDYKTGVAWGFGGDAFKGGRRLQHALYAHAAEARLGSQVVDGQYHFPTRRGENQAFIFDRVGLSGIGDLVDHMFDGVAEGSFIPTDDAGDCKFCDFGEICRVRSEDYGKTSSPLADWSAEHLNTGLWPAFSNLKRVRTFED